MNLVLCLAVVLVCGYIGRQLAARAAQRLAFFREYESAMVGLADSVAGMSLELSRSLEVSCGETVGAIFAECARRLRNEPQRRFAVLWRECFETAQPACLSKEDARIIADAGEAVEALCRNPSRKQAEGYLGRLGAYIAGMEDDKRKKSKLYGAGGVLAGLLIALLLI